MTVGADDTADSYPITANAEKTNGYHGATAERSLQVTVRPPVPNLTGVAVAVGGAVAGAGVAVATRRGGQVPSDQGSEDENDPDPCQQAEKRLREASKRVLEIWNVLQDLGNKLNALDSAYESTRQSGYNWALFGVLLAAVFSYGTSLLETAATSEGSIPTVSSTFERVRNVAAENLK